MGFLVISRLCSLNGGAPFFPFVGLSSAQRGFARPTARHRPNPCPIEEPDWPTSAVHGAWTAEDPLGLVLYWNGAVCVEVIRYAMRKGQIRKLSAISLCYWPECAIYQHATIPTLVL